MVQYKNYFGYVNKKFDVYVDNVKANSEKLDAHATNKLTYFTLTTGNASSDDKIYFDNVKLYSDCEDIYTTIVFNYNGATGNNSLEDTHVIYGTKLGTLPVPTKTWYNFKGWYLENNYITEVTSEMIFNDVEVININAKWEVQTFNVDTSVIGGNGPITENSIVDYNSNKKITFTPAMGYMIDMVKVNNVPVDISNNSYTLTNITENKTIVVTYKKIPCTIILNEGTGFKVDPVSPITVEHGSNKEITITADLGYKLVSVKVDGIEKLPLISNNKSTNNNIKDLKVEGYELNSTEGNTYSLTVDNNVADISISASTEDSKASIEGIGKHDLVIGLNTFEVIVTSESGIQNKFIINITRKDGYYLEDIDNTIKNSKLDNIQIIIDSDSKINEEILKKIKLSKKKVTFNYFNEEKKILYSWIIDGSKISDTIPFDTNLIFESKESKSIDKLSNYADGLYLSFNHNGKLPNETKVKIYVGNKYGDNDKLNVYYYNKDNNKLELISNELKVESGYIEFNIEHCSEYFVSMSKINISSINSTKINSINIFIIISIFEFIFILGLIIIDYLHINPIYKIRKK